MILTVINHIAPLNQLSFFDWLRGHLLPCPFKYLTGIDCPGCGFQRSFVALLQGQFRKSWELYPATVPFLLAVVYTVFKGWLKPGSKEKPVTYTVYIFTGSVMMVSYILKMYHLYMSA